MKTMMPVEVVDTALVAPSEETPRQPLWLSNLDLAVPRTHTPLVYYYPAPAQGGAAAGFESDRLKAALAGRLGGAAPDGRLQIDCNGEGALFVVARADLTGDDIFEDFEPSPEIRRAFVPSPQPDEASCPMAVFQV